MVVTAKAQAPPRGATGDETRRRVLLIAYSFPPVGGAGVQRPTKWVKYLPDFGWDVTVLTPANPSVPVRDDSLLAEIPRETRIVRAPTWEPDYRRKEEWTGDRAPATAVARCLSGVKRVARRVAQAVLQPDLQVLWTYNALRAATEELRRVRHDAIVVTVPPYSALSVGVALKRRFAVPLVFDFRDEWDLSRRYLEQAPRGGWSQFVQTRMQRSLLKHADAVITTTQASAETYRQKLAEVGNAAGAHCIYNGFDPDDFAVAAGAQPLGRTGFRLVYTGTLWNLTNVEPLVLAVERVNAANPALLSGLELVCVGRSTPEQRRLLERLRGTPCRLELRDYCSHAEVAHWLHGADALCLLLSDVPGAERVVPAKLFEYLASGKPILAILPHGEAARLLRQFLPDGHFLPRDINGIAGWLADRLRTDSASPAVRPSYDGLEEFSRPAQAGRLADVLNEATGGAVFCSRQLQEGAACPARRRAT
jgi:glycosyltransferase involved in cell wall biosynthesis